MVSANSAVKDLNKGREIMKLVYISIFFLASAVAEAQDGFRELSYDDGVPNMHYSYLTNGPYHAVRFTPLSTPAQVVRIRYYIADTTRGSRFSLWIYKALKSEPGVPLFGPVALRASGYGWEEHEMTAADVWVTDDFYVLLQQAGDHPTIRLAVEDRPPLSGHTWDTDC